jgi:hypothetical protein
MERPRGSAGPFLFSENRTRNQWAGFQTRIPSANQIKLQKEVLPVPYMKYAKSEELLMNPQFCISTYPAIESNPQKAVFPIP